MSIITIKNSATWFFTVCLLTVANVEAQEYCGYPEVYKVSTVTLDTQVSGSHFVCDVIQNQKGLWTLGTLRSANYVTGEQDSILLTRFDDTGRMEWNLRLDVLQSRNETPKFASTDDQGVVIVGCSRLNTSGLLLVPWIANVGPSGNLRWIRKLDPFGGTGIQGSAFFNNVETKSNGEIWAVGSVSYNNVYFPFFLRVNRFGNMIDCRVFTESNQTLPFITRWHEYRDIIPYGNSMLIAGVYQELLNTVPPTTSRFQPVLTLFDSMGNFVKNSFFKSELPNVNYEVREVIRSTRHPERVFLVGSRSDETASSKRLLWAACIDVTLDSLIWQNSYDTIESWAQRAYFDRDKLIVLYRANRTDGNAVDGIMQLDSMGNWEFVNHVKAGMFAMQSAETQNLYYQTRNSVPLRDGGLACAGYNALVDTCNLQVTWTKPCEPNFCASIPYSVKSFRASALTPRATKGHTVLNSTISALTPTQFQISTTYQSVSCRLCPLPIINVSNVILCDFPLYHVQDVWDIYSKVTWFDGDNSKYKAFDRTGSFWLIKDNACGTVRDTFSIFKENRPVKVLNDNEYFCSGRMLTLKALQPNPGNFTYRWSTGAREPELNVTEGKTYSLTTTSNGCGSRTDIVNVFESNCDCQICVPNSITPYNSDGVNDEWLPRTDCKYLNCAVKEGYYYIFNRWGEKIAENPIKVAWNGKDSKGDFVPRGVYVYQIKIVFDESVEGNRIINESGNITVW
jgi:hypothetical protein